MATLKVRRVRYQGDNWQFVSPELRDGANLIVGSNGAGKTTFSDLLYYGLGGGVSQFHGKHARLHKQVARDKNNFVEIQLELNDAPYTLRRYIGTNDIGVRPYTGHPEAVVFPLTRRGGSRTFSDWILDLIGVEPIRLQQGATKWMLGFNDLARLMYQSQKRDDHHVFKPADVSSFISDSSYVRRTIFEILMGQSQPEMHRLIGIVQKLGERRRALTGELDAFKNAAQLLLGTEPETNIEYLRAELDASEEQLARLCRAIDALTHVQDPASSLLDEINQARERIQPLDRELRRVVRQEKSILLELSGLQSARRSLVLEATQINKILFSDDRLDLFSPDTCPYCLTEIDRGQNQCICGTPVEEGEYRRFFYSPGEYLGMLKSRQKNVETIEHTIEDLTLQSVELEQMAGSIRTRINDAQAKLYELLSRRSSLSSLPRKLTELEEKRSDVVTRVSSLEGQIALEERRQVLEEELSRVTRELEEQRIELKALEAATSRAMISTRRRFNEQYSKLVMRTIENCRSAQISENYDPIINNGEYVEASAGVPLRLMFAAVMMRISLESPEVAFPRFLLIDTPQDAGIDPDNLRNSIARFFDSLAEFDEHRWQVVLTTGPGTYPEALEDNVALRLSEGEHLLQPMS